MDDFEEGKKMEKRKNTEISKIFGKFLTNTSYKK